MKQIKKRRMFALVVVVSSVLWIAPPASAAPHGITSLVPGIQPKTDGTFVVWDARNSLRAARLDDPQSFVVASGTGEFPIYDIDNGIVVWAPGAQNCGGPCDKSIRGKNLYTGQEYFIDTPPYGAPYGEAGPAISGTIVVWENNNRVLGRDLAAMEPPFTVAAPEAPWNVGSVVVGGNSIVWSEVIRDPDGSIQVRFRLLELGGGAPTTLVEGVWPNADAPGVPRGPTALIGDVLFYVLDQRLTALNLRTKETRSYNTTGGTTDGRYVFRHHFREQDQGEELRGYDLLSGSDFLVVAGDNVVPDTAGGVLVWDGQRRPGQYSSDAYDVFVARIADVVPTAPRPAPPAPIPDSQHFPETGHALSGGFRAFWERNGGLPVFGYPLTEEFDEHNPDLGQPFTVQYVERQRFEYHPENAGTPYEVLLGRLGAAEAQALGLTTTPPFQPQPATPDTSTCSFVRETGHRVCEPFRAYWQTHGLEFGDGGVSYREALALWGYPLSEAYTDAETGRLVQYFERARFELHPDNPPEFQVLVGRLGVRPLVERGWLTAE